MPGPIYEPLVEENLDVRFLTLFPADRFDADIRCRVYRASVMDDTYPTFKALSYCWGTLTPPQHITLNGSSLDVGPNLASALRHLRSNSANVELWVDALCINQGDLDERSSQVKLMDSMYGDAEEVVVWLGGESHESNEAMDLIKQWSEWFDRGGRTDANAVARALPLAFDASAVGALGNLLRRPYWERVWVVQEVACAKEVVVMCGRKTLPFDDFEKACAAWDRVCGSLGPRPGDVSRHSLLDSARQRNLRQMIWYRDFRIMSYTDWDQPRAPFLEVIESCRHLKCSDPRDKIYGFLTLGGPHTKHFTAIASPDYNKAVTQVYCEVARRLLLDDGSLRLVALASNIRSCPSNATQLPSLPSWVPDWTCPDRLSSLYLPFTGATKRPRSSVDIQGFVRFSENQRVLFAKGSMYGKVAKTFPPDWLSDLEGNKTDILDAFLGRTCADGMPKLQALFRVMTLNMAWPEVEDWLECQSFLHKTGWYLRKLWPQGEEDGPLDAERGLPLASDVFSGAPASLLAEFGKMTCSSTSWKESGERLDVIDFSATTQRRVSHRLLFETEEGRLGLGPPDMQAGDKICILHGYPGPFCLVAEGTWFLARGECCLASVRLCDAADGLNMGPPVDIEIH